ncbi:MAG: DUF58 domain-containing protein [Treponema sp.]|jgi:uncharacterized protein (DUF58 family)|nr:DUF58 domain-containing protein [Treponema sp.]
MRETESRSLLLPGRALFITSLLYLFLGCTAFFFEGVFLVWLLTGAGIIPFIVTDLLLLVLLGDRLRPEREIALSLAQDESVRVKLFIRRTGRPLLPSSIRLYDLYPDAMSTGAFPAVFPAVIDRKALLNSDTIVFEYTLLPGERGTWSFFGTEFLLGSPLRFWRLRVTHDVMSHGRTYPNFKHIARGTEIKGKPEKGEIRHIRKRGQGLEFESLRDYQEGDSIRLIDWRATSRSRRMDGGHKLIVRNYQEEQDQQVLFIIDSGYRLPDFEFDSALCAMLLLSHTALKHGDAVAAASFGAHDRWIPPRKGMSAFTGLMNGLYDLHSAPVPSSPFSALENALDRLHRRSFIILISNFREEDGESLAWILPRIERRHLLLMVSFRESDAETLAFSGASAGTSADTSADTALSPAADQEILETAAAWSYLANRRRLYRKWEHSGLLVLETSPQHISSELINKYLSVKKSGRL